ncbi:MAG: Fe-S cluster assembly protein SufD [Prevotellaceae bacterium]|nr:Fe-S cluster assembly protein SufD [Prevotellaceae bacterium]
MNNQDATSISSPLGSLGEAKYIDLYKQERETIRKNSSVLFTNYREESFERFRRLGFPTTKQDDYKYTDLTSALSVDYALNTDVENSGKSPYDVFKCTVQGIKSYLYFVLNDAFYPSDVKKETLPEGVVIGSLKEIAGTRPELIERYFAKQSAKKEDGMAALNGIFAQDGFFMYVPKNVSLDKPVQLINIMRHDSDFMANSHNLVILEEGAKAQLLVCDHTADDVRFFSNRVTEVFVAENAVYEHYKLENTHSKTTNVSTLLIDQKESSKVLNNIITLHNGLTRNNIEIALNGEHTETLLCGMAVGDKNQEVDNYTSILHNKPNCHSTELFKYILGDESKGGFTGRIYVAEDAQKTEAYQNSKNILLDKTARMRTKPQLEIYADDVRCSHGATIGQLDETAMFYLQSRGISESEARLLLMYAFTADVIENIRIDALKDRIKLMTEHRLRNNSASSDSCVICR